MKLVGTYADFDRFIILHDSFTPKAFLSGDARRAFYRSFKSLEKFLFDHEHTKKIQDMQKRIDSFTTSFTEELRNDPERKKVQDDLNKEIVTMNELKDEIIIEHEFDDFAWDSFKKAFELEGETIYPKAKSLAIIEDWIAKVDEDNK